jgi:hypothetical protein
VKRDQLRHAIGQLLDYGRFVETKTHTVLAPSRPRPDLLALARAVGVDVVYPDGDRWIRVSATA